MVALWALIWMQIADICKAVTIQLYDGDPPNETQLIKCYSLLLVFCGGLIDPFFVLPNLFCLKKTPYVYATIFLAVGLLVLLLMVPWDFLWGRGGVRRRRFRSEDLNKLEMKMKAG